MEFITVRDLRTRPGQIWDKLRQQHDLILTSSGRPIAVLSHIGEGGVEEALAAQGRDRLSADEIEAEITAARTERKESVP